MVAEAGHHSNRVYFDQAGNLHLNGASLFDASEVDQAANLGGGGTNINGVAGGYKIARGEAALDGSNPTPITTGLTTCIAVCLTLKGSATPGDSTSVLTALIGTADFDVYAWKNTTGSDPTLVASTGTESFYWIAIGT